MECPDAPSLLPPPSRRIPTASTVASVDTITSAMNLTKHIPTDLLERRNWLHQSILMHPSNAEKSDGMLSLSKQNQSNQNNEYVNARSMTRRLKLGLIDSRGEELKTPTFERVRPVPSVRAFSAPKRGKKGPKFFGTRKQSNPLFLGKRKMDTSEVRPPTGYEPVVGSPILSAKRDSSSRARRKQRQTERKMQRLRQETLAARRKLEKELMLAEIDRHQIVRKKLERELMLAEIDRHQMKHGWKNNQPEKSTSGDKFEQMWQQLAGASPHGEPGKTREYVEIDEMVKIQKLQVNEQQGVNKFLLSRFETWRVGRQRKQNESDFSEK